MNYTKETIDFYGFELVASRTPDGKGWVAIKEICTAIGLRNQPQQAKLRRSPARFNCHDIVMVAADGKLRKSLCLDVEQTVSWIRGINPDRVRPECRDKLSLFQREIDRVLYEHFAKGWGVQQGDYASLSRRVTENELIIQALGERVELLERKVDGEEVADNPFKRKVGDKVH